MDKIKSIIHIAHDEKFIDAAYEIYEKAFPDKNLFLILVNDKKDGFKYLSHDKEYEIIEIKDDYLRTITSFFNDAKLIVFHSVKHEYVKVQRNISKIAKFQNIKQIWTVFGFEVYLNPFIMNNRSIIGKRSYKSYIKSNIKVDENKRILKTTIKRFYYKMFVKRYNSKSFLKRFIDRISNFNEDSYFILTETMRGMDIIAMFIKEEYILYKRLGIVSKNTKYLRFSYNPVNVIIKDYGGPVKSNNILLGNSATPTNNHLEAFDILNEFDLKEKKIITPLSYGNSYYTDDILKLGSQIFGTSFHPLTLFLPLDEYQNLMRTCGIVIMNHYRPQAVGNVLTAMHMGAKVYLSERNNLFHYLKRIGCYIFCIESDLKVSNKMALQLLSGEEMNYNKKILNEELSIDRITGELQEKLKNIVN